MNNDYRVVDEYGCGGENRFVEPNPMCYSENFSPEPSDYREESTPMTQLNFFQGSRATPSSKTQVGKQEERAQNREERLLAMIETLL